VSEPASESARPSLSVVVPFFQEEDSARAMVAEVAAALSGYGGPWELLCVDDGSGDATPERLDEAAAEHEGAVRVLRLRRNFGQTAALQAGIDAATGELIASLDGDLQNDPADLPRLVDELLAWDLDLLCGWRRDRQDGLLRRVPSRLANALIGRVTGVRLHDYGCSAKVYRAEVLREIRLFGEMHRFVPVWMATVTAPERIGETVVHHRARAHGRSKYGLSRTFRVLLDLLAVSFFLRYRARPGHFFGSIGLVIGGLGAGVMAYLGAVKFGLGQDIGHRPLFFVGILLLLASIQFLTAGVLAEMLARTFFGSARLRPYSVRPAPPPARPAAAAPAPTPEGAPVTPAPSGGGDD